MVSRGLMIFLMVQYALIAGFALYESNINRCLYFIGALLISLAVIRMK